MPILIGLLGNKWVWIGLLIAALGIGVKVQTARLDSAKAHLTSLQADYDTFKARVAAEGRAAQERADKQAQADKSRKEKADAENQRTRALDTQRIASLRYDADHRGSYSLPPAPAGSGRPDLACFDRSAFESASRIALAGLREIADGCDAATVDLNSARQWAAKP